MCTRKHKRFYSVMGTDKCVADSPACYKSLSLPSGPKCPESVPRGVFGALRAPGSGVSKKKVSRECPRSVRCHLFAHSGDTLGTLFGHSGARGPKGPKNTPRDTLGTLRARRDRETPVAGRGVRKTSGGVVYHPGRNYYKKFAETIIFEIFL